MKLTYKKDLCLNRPYINLKKLSSTTSIRKGNIDEKGLKTTYIIDQKNEDLFYTKDFKIEYSKGIEKEVYDTSILDKTLLVDINYVTRTGDSSAKFKVYLILNGIKYALSFIDFEDIYKNCLEILTESIKDQTELSYIKAGFKNLSKDEIVVDHEKNLERLEDFKVKVDRKLNTDFYVLNNVLTSLSKFDINNNKAEIEVSDDKIVLRYNYSYRLYTIVKATDSKVKLQETDIICDLTDKNAPLVSIYTYYGLGKLLDIKNNVIPTDKNAALFANLIDLDIPVLK